MLSHKEKIATDAIRHVLARVVHQGSCEVAVCSESLSQLVTAYAVLTDQEAKLTENIRLGLASGLEDMLNANPEPEPVTR